MPEVIVSDDSVKDNAFVSGLHGTIAEQRDESHYDRRGSDGTDDDLTKGRIRFPLGRLYGRESELNDLRSVYNAVTGQGGTDAAAASVDQPKPTKRVVFIAGLSGTGKSALVEETVKRATAEEVKAERPERRPIFGWGKFAERHVSAVADAPFSALADAIAKWSAELLTRANDDGVDGIEDLRRVRSNLKKAGVSGADEGGRVLIGMFPALELLLFYKDEKETKNEVEEKKEEEEKRRVSEVASMGALKIVIQNFVISLCRSSSRQSCVRPLLLFIDDMQWADEASLEVISALLMNEALDNFLFIGAYRSNEVQGEDHPLVKKISEIQKGAGDDAVMQMEVSNLSPNDIGIFIGDCIEKDVDEVAALTELVFRLTLGNIMFARSCLEELVRRNVLYFDIITYEWQWNLDMPTEVESFVNGNVVDMIKNKIKTLDDLDQRALKLAAHTRNTIDAETLKYLLNADGGISLETDQVKSILDRAVSEGLLLNRAAELREYSFAHDLIQEASFAHIHPGEEENALLVLIGTVLAKRYTSTGEEWMLFVAVSHMNSVPRQFIASQEELAKLNLAAAKLASAKAAISQAANYLQSGVDCCMEGSESASTRWANHYDLLLELNNEKAKALLALGKYDEAEAATKEVVQNAICRSDKSVAHLTMLRISTDTNNRDYNVSVEKGIEILAEYDRKLPMHPSKLYSAKESLLLKLKRRNRPLIALANAAVMKDDSAMYLYAEVQNYTGLSKNYSLGAVILNRALQIAYSKGISPGLAHIVALNCARLMKNGKYQTAHGYSELAKKILSRFPDEQSGPANVKLLYTLWCTAGQSKFSFSKDIGDLHEWHKTLIAGGLVEWGLGCGMCYCLSYFAAGLPLSAIMVSKITLYERASYELNVRGFGLIFKVSRQYVLNLLGKSNTDPTAFEGEAFNEEEALSLLEGNPKDMALRDVGTFRLQLAYIFNDEKTMQEMIERLKSYPLFDLITVRQHLRITFLGLASLRMGIRTKNREYVKIGTKVMKEIRKLDRAGSVNAHPVYLCLLASKSPSKAAFDNAIAACSDAQVVHLKAMMNERCAELLLSQNDLIWREYMQSALFEYRSWGATSKVQSLKEQHEFLQNDARLSSTSNGSMISGTSSVWS